MKKHHFIILLKCVGITAIGFVLVNILHVFIDLTQINLIEIESITFKKGALFFDGYSSGLRIGEPSGNRALWIMFVFMAIINLNKTTTLFPEKSK